MMSHWPLDPSHWSLDCRRSLSSINTQSRALDADGHSQLKALGDGCGRHFCLCSVRVAAEKAGVLSRANAPVLGLESFGLLESNSGARRI